MKKIVKIDNKKYIFASKYDNFNHLYGVSNENKKDIDKKLEDTLSFYKDSYISINNQEKIPLIQLSKSANINSSVYHAETYNRVNSLREYAKDVGFDTPIFITLTAPSKYKPLKQIKLKNYIKLVDNPKFTGETDYIRLARDYISKKWCSFLQTQIFKDIRKKYNHRVVFLRTYEPHLDGCPHSHIVCFIPNEFKERFIKLVKNYFKTRTDVKSDFNGDLGGVISYILKYVLKSFKNGKNGVLCDVAYWYAKNNIRRFSTSRTLIPMYIYRKIIRDEKFRDLKKMTNLFKNGFISCDLIADTDKYLENGRLLSKDYKIDTIIVSIAGFDYLEHHIAYKRSDNIEIHLSNKNKESKEVVRKSRELYKQAFKQASKDGKFDNKFEKYKRYLDRLDSYNNQNINKKSVDSLSDYDLIDLHNHFIKCDIAFYKQPLKFAYIENELNKRNLKGLTVFKKEIKLTNPYDIVLKYANAGFCDLLF